MADSRPSGTTAVPSAHLTLSLLRRRESYIFRFIELTGATEWRETRELNETKDISIFSTSQAEDAWCHRGTRRTTIQSKNLSVLTGVERSAPGWFHLFSRQSLPRCTYLSCRPQGALRSRTTYPDTAGEEPLVWSRSVGSMCVL